jgi:hypothetical protein
MGLSYMNAATIKKVDNIIDKMRTEGATNIWAGLESGLSELSKNARKGCNSCLFLLTDGQPTEHASADMIRRFRQYKDKNVNVPSVSTFGFGYGIDTELLSTTAKDGNGMYSFIPDCSFVGTTFVNATSNVLATMGTNVSINVEHQNGAQVIGVFGDHNSSKSSYGSMVHLPSLQYGQSLDLVLKMDIPEALPKDQPFVEVTIKFNHWMFGTTTKTVQGFITEKESPEVSVQLHRLKLVSSLLAMVKHRGSEKDCKPLIDKLAAKLSEDDPREKGMKEDLTGQITEAIMPAYFQRWGRHYLPSLCRSHQLQQCNNFMDPGIQNYGGARFNALRDDIDALFSKLPAPKPSKVRAVANNANYTPNFTMAAYNTGGGCFAGSCLVRLANGTHKRVADIQKGDVVATLNGQSARVLCVMKIHCDRQQAELVEFEGGLLITPYHPVRIAGKWSFPQDLQKSSKIHCPYVYNFVLEDGVDHVMIVNDVECVTLGHSYKEDVVRHPYFGSQRIVDDLREIEGFNNGFVEVADHCFVRDSKTMMVCGIARGAVITSNVLVTPVVAAPNWIVV